MFYDTLHTNKLKKYAREREKKKKRKEEERSGSIDRSIDLARLVERDGSEDADAKRAPGPSHRFTRNATARVVGVVGEREKSERCENRRREERGSKVEGGTKRGVSPRSREGRGTRKAAKREGSFRGRGEKLERELRCVAVVGFDR